MKWEQAFCGGDLVMPEEEKQSSSAADSVLFFISFPTVGRSSSSAAGWSGARAAGSCGAFLLRLRAAGLRKVLGLSSAGVILRNRLLNYHRIWDAEIPHYLAARVTLLMTTNLFLLVEMILLPCKGN